MVVGDDFHFRIWRSMEQKETPAHVAYQEGDEAYTNDGISVLKKLTPVQADEGNFFINCYPNPSSGITHFEFYVKVPSDIVLKIYDVTGTLVNKQIAKDVIGKSKLTFDSRNLPQGRYNYTVITSGASHSGSYLTIQ